MIDTPCSTKALRRSSSVSVQDPDIKRPMLDRTLDDFDDIGEAAAHLIKFELAMLAELGFGLDLENCAATGQTTELMYVSPKCGGEAPGQRQFCFALAGRSGQVSQRSCPWPAR